MDWIETPQSSSMARFRYDPAQQVLSIEFRSGATYDYFEVPPAVFASLKAAPSKGLFHSREIRGQYRYSRA